MPTRTANAKWTGGLKDGNGNLSTGSGAVDGAYSFGTRFQEEPGTNPEELIAAAHAGCFSMALSAALEKAGHKPESVATTAKVLLEKQGEGFAITRIDLLTDAHVPGIDAAAFHEHAEGAKKNCPVSKALASVDITLEANLRT